ncbi:nucleotide exchange factor GrpE [Streptomyces kaniharaensis]|uniref:Nucleotide exchange factor GrpE n=1 Tax=Streptomyces kaniharaensis TaxID=212423 RepID=A0A6N7KMB0_9ACTN|nr:nucleotide exchange factor GrpE [Streptomyces kaniharaensis]MQS11284.1 nucleotide exchange factor GrpE [Streptomyces kaniharaensis]
MTTTRPPSSEPLAPLPVPQRALELDLDQAFTQLLFRASLLQRKRAEEAEAARAAQRDLLGVLVEVDDALAALGLDGELVQLGRGAGIEATRRRLLGRLARAGVRPMRLEGLAADPALTEIVGSEARPGVAPETVVRTVVTGFFWGEDVLRRAQVVVAAYVPGAEVPADEVERALVPEPKPEEPEGVEEPAEPKPDEPRPDEPGHAAAPVIPAQPKAARARVRRGGVAPGGRRKRKKK